MLLAKPFGFARRPITIVVFFFLCIILVATRTVFGTYEYTTSFHRGGLQRLFSNNHVYNNTLYRPGTENLVHRQWNFSDQCSDFPDVNGIQLVMKTGASEMFEKLPAHLLTSMPCIPDALLFSDKDHQIGQWHLHNVLEDIDESLLRGTAELELYKTQLACPVSQPNCINAKGKLSAAWVLDKYKFLHMMFRTWQMRPDKQWYVFIEADTYVFWPTLATWLRSHVSPKDNIYVGSVALVREFPFAHGGSGYVISGTLLRSLVEKGSDLVADMDRRARDHCCGDLLLAYAINEQLGVRVKQAHPMFNGEKASTLPYGPDLWCQPVFTMHHMDGEEVSAAWQFEQTRKKKNDVVVMSDLFHAFVRPHLVERRDGWDNLSDDTCYVAPSDAAQRHSAKHYLTQKDRTMLNVVEREAHRGVDECSAVCDFDGIDINRELAELRERNGKADGASKDDGNDNSDGEAEKSAVKSASSEELRQLLEAHPQRAGGCFQWRYQSGICCTSRTIKLGASTHVGNGGEPWISGWQVKGIENWVEARGQCQQVAWQKPRNM